MNAIIRFVSLGLQDADRRVAAALAPRPLGPIDGYLRTSMIVTAIDRATMALSASWLASRSARIGRSWMATAGHDASGTRALGSGLLLAVAVHVTLTLVQGPRPGWFWILIPGMVLAIAVLLLAGLRSASRP